MNSSLSLKYEQFNFRYFLLLRNIAMSYPWSTINTQNIDIQTELKFNSDTGNPGEVPFKLVGTQEWKKN